MGGCRGLDSLYYEASSKGALGGVERLLRATKKCSRKEVQEWLRTQDVYTLHKPYRRNYLRNRVLVSRKDDIWQMDLVDMQDYKRDNLGYAYLLTCIDVFSKYAWAVPIKSKTSRNIIDAVDKILGGGRKPGKIHTDKGMEFLNKPFQDFLKQRAIGFFTTNSEMKASVVERFNRTLKSRMWRYFTHRGTYAYLDVIDSLLKGYNSSYHRSIRMSPDEVNTKNSSRVWKNLYSSTSTTPLSTAFRVGDQVRISKTKRTFDKGYLPNWTDEVFVIDSILSKRRPTVYKIKDLAGETIEGVFYKEELQHVVKSADDLWRIEKVLEERGKGKNRRVLVKWRGYSDKHNSWVKASDLVDLDGVSQ